MLNENGLRFCGDHYQSRCCGREVSCPVGPDEDYIFDTDDGTPITTEHFPDADAVCPGCERTWPAECSHDDLTLLTPSNPGITEGERAFRGHCEDCDQPVRVFVQVTDVRVEGNE